ncbi:MAG: hypothetical protein JRH11_22240, partial [Deltaproteobacteria bacterium]|nr:hypothetical protein [Deltaproteobacteria bacterium]
MIASSERDDSPAGAGLPSPAAGLLEAAGFNAVGILSLADYDARVPPTWRASRLCAGARSAVILACGGAGFYRAARAAHEAADPQHPLDSFARRVLDEAAQALGGQATRGRVLHYFDRVGAGGELDAAGDFVDLVALAAASGLGVTSRLRLLLHPQFGPWLSIRALVLTPLELAATP